MLKRKKREFTESVVESLRLQYDAIGAERVLHAYFCSIRAVV